MMRAAILSATILISACAGTIKGNAMLETDAGAAIPRIVGDNWSEQDLRIKNPETATVIIYSHGTKRPWSYDDCENRWFTTPPVIASMDGGDVHVVRQCSLAIEKAERADAGNQVYGKAGELTRLAKGYAQIGVRPDRIFLTGNSNGGWSSLMAYAQEPDAFGGVIAFAPAFAGKRSESVLFPWWRGEVRPRQAAELSNAPRLRALIFAYPGDPFNRPRDLTFLPEAHPSSVELISYGCGLSNPHGTYRKDCRKAETRAAILEFIAGPTS